MRCTRYSCFKPLVSALMVVGCCYMQPVRAQAAPVASPGYTARLNSAINGVVVAKLARWGFAANDPRVKATAYGISTGLTVLSGTAMAAGATVSWPVLLVAAGLAGVAGGAIKLASDSDFKWTFNQNGSVAGAGTLPSAPAVIPGNGGATTTIPLESGKGAWFIVKNTYVTGVGWKKYEVWGTNQVQLASSADPECVGEGSPFIPPSGMQTVCRYSNGSTMVLYINPGTSPYSSATGYFDTAPPLPPQSVNYAYASTKEAAEKIPAAIQNSAVAVDALTAAVNAAWKAAVDANTSGGLPWSASDPVTPAEVQQWMNANPSSVPTVSDFTSPANSTSGSPSISIGSSSSPGTGGSTSPGTGTGGNTGTTPEPSTDPDTAPVTPGKGEEINWGPNPNVGAPTLEETPTASKILDPIFNVMPELKSFDVPSHKGECPVESFELYSKKYTINSHCGLIESNRSAISACALLCFALASLFIVLKA